MKMGENGMICASARRHSWRGVAGFSLKRFSGGNAHYRVGNLTRRVDPNHYFLVNQGQAYEIDIDSPSLVTSRCLFFRNGLIGDVIDGVTRSTDWALDHLSQAGDKELSQQLYPIDSSLQRYLSNLEQRISSNSCNQLEREELFHVVGRQLVLRSRQETQMAEKVEAAKESTRRELYRRVVLARDYILSNWERSISLQEMAKVSSLSPNHLLRSLRAIYRVSPGSFQQSIRLKAAVTYLGNRDSTVTQIAQECGFESLPSFIRLFRSRFGASPIQFRKKVISDKT